MITPSTTASLYGAVLLIIDRIDGSAAVRPTLGKRDTMPVVIGLRPVDKAQSLNLELEFGLDFTR